MAVLFLVGHEQLNHLVPRAGEAVQAAGGDGSTQLVERQRGAENLDLIEEPRLTDKTFSARGLGCGQTFAFDPRSSTLETVRTRGRRGLRISRAPLLTG